MWKWWKRQAPSPWFATIGCEGGPVIVADAPEYRVWTGSAPASAGQTKLHVWGNFTAELPERFHPGGTVGHFYLEFGTAEAVQDAYRDLVAFVQTRWPGSDVQPLDGGGRFVRPDGAQQFAQFSPSSEYEAACIAGDGIGAWTWRVSNGGTVLLWEVEGAGLVHVSRDRALGQVILLRSWADDDSAEAAAQSYVLAGPAGESVSEALVVRDGTLVVSWAAPAFGDLVGVPDVAILRRRARDGQPVSLSNGAIDGYGTILAVDPGVYTVETGHLERETWIALWARLSRVPGTSGAA